MTTFGDIAKGREGRDVIYIATIYQDRCQLRYGKAPCTAAIGVTGTTQCFNTFRTCQDQPNYTTSVDNQVLYNADFTNAAWTKNNLTAPGVPTIDSIVAEEVAQPVFETAVNANHSLVQSGFVTNVDYRFTASVWVKPGAGLARGVRFSIDLPAGSGVSYISVDPTTGFVNALVNVDYYFVEVRSDGWVRITITTPIQLIAGAANITLYNTDTPSSDVIAFLGDITTSMYWFGASFTRSDYITPTLVTTTPALSVLNTLPLRVASEDVTELQAPGTPPISPTLISVDTGPTRLDIGKGLGIRSSLRLTLQDFYSADSIVDPYAAERPTPIDWNDREHGTWWQRRIAQVSSFEGRRIDLLLGAYLQDGSIIVDPSIARTYIIEDLTVPDENGVLTLIAKDPLKLADEGRSNIPLPSRARVRILQVAAASILDFTDPDGIVLEYWNLGQIYLNIEDEVMEMVSPPVNVGGDNWQLTGLLRADAPDFYDDSLNEDVDHDIDKTVQPCWFFDNQPIADVVYNLLNFQIGIDSVFLPKTEWDQSIITGGLGTYLLNTLIAKPVDIKKLLVELSQLNLLIWWDERRSVVRLRALTITEPAAIVFDDDANIIRGSFAGNLDMQNRRSQVWVYHGHRFPTKDVTIPEWFAAVEIVADLDAESEFEYGSPRIESIFSRWLIATQTLVAGEVTDRLLRAYRDPREIVQITLDAKDFEIWTGDTIGIITSRIVSILGEALRQDYIVIEAKELLSPEGIKYKLTLQATGTLVRTGGIAPDIDPENPPNPFPVYNVASDNLKDLYVFIAQNDGTFSPSGDSAYQIQ